MLRTFCGLLLALFPIDSISAFYFRVPYDFFHGGTAYGIALLCLLGALISSFVCPIPLGVWYLYWRNKTATLCLVLSLLAAAASLTILYFDPGHRIAAFMAE